MSLKTLLDDAAATATADLRIDLADARARAGRRQALDRRRLAVGVGSAVAVAAVVALVAVLLPGGGLRAVAPFPAATSSGPTGLPDRWFQAPPWTPPVTRHPMAAASLVLGSTEDSGKPPLLVSADAREYAALPWAKGDRQVTLARDGTSVAWVSPAGRQQVVHRIALPTGRQRDATLPTSSAVRQLVWAGGALTAVTDAATYQWPADASGWRRVCGCTLLLGAAADGHLVDLAPTAPLRIHNSIGAGALGHVEPFDPGGPDPGYVSGAPGDSVTDAGTSPPAGPRLTADPSGTRWAQVVRERFPSSPVGYRWRVAVSEAVGTPLLGYGFPIGSTAQAPVTGAELVGWGPAGIVVRVSTRNQRGGADDMSLRRYVPREGQPKIVARRVPGAMPVVAMADDVFRTQTPVTAAEPRPPTLDRSHISFLFHRAWDLYRGRLIALAVLLAGLVAAGTVVLLRRRRMRG